MFGLQCVSVIVCLGTLQNESVNNQSVNNVNIASRLSCWYISQLVSACSQSCVKEPTTLVMSTCMYAHLGDAHFFPVSEFCLDFRTNPQAPVNKDL